MPPDDPTSRRAQHRSRRGSATAGTASRRRPRVEVFYVLATTATSRPTYKAAIDGLYISGGDQKGFPGNRNEHGGGRLANAPGQTGTAPDETFVLDIQGGAIMANAYARFLRITNNNVVANSGASGAIRIGTPQLGTDTEDGNARGDPATGEIVPAYDQQNTDLRLAYNRITANGGTSLGGAWRSSTAASATASTTTSSAATSPQSTAAPSATSACRRTVRSTTTRST